MKKECGFRNVECGMWNARGEMAVPQNLNNKSQIANIKQITMTEIQNPKHVIFDLI